MPSQPWWSNQLWVCEGDAYLIILFIFVDSIDHTDALAILRFWISPNIFTQMICRTKNPCDKHLILLIWEMCTYESMVLCARLQKISLAVRDNKILWGISSYSRNILANMLLHFKLLLYQLGCSIYCLSQVIAEREAMQHKGKGKRRVRKLGRNSFSATFQLCDLEFHLTSLCLSLVFTSRGSWVN